MKKTISVVITTVRYAYNIIKLLGSVLLLLLYLGGQSLFDKLAKWRLNQR